MYLIMLGAQGTGKGTVAGILAKETGWPQISTGDIFRANISNNTELGKKANEYISKGQLVPDDITVPMVINRLSEDDCKDGAILDGFPRTVEQAEKLDEILAEKSKKFNNTKRRNYYKNLKQKSMFKSRMQSNIQYNNASI